MQSRKFLAFLAILFVMASALLARSLASVKPDFLSELELAVWQELNLARTQPQVYVRLLEDYRSQFSGKLVKRPGKVDLMTQEGVAAVDDAIAALKAQKPLPELRISRGMTQAARDHVKDTGPRGLIGHHGSDGSTPFARMERYGKWQRTAGENVSYGADNGRDVILQLIIDDGVPSRGHRKNILNPTFGVVGVACGPHRNMGIMCVQTFAGDYQER
ncbi:MAG: CAP domain-containing protein [Leptospiraceae bacterium]|nr:CAP domain-containing protein [Leptospiraceae bacterium]